MAKKYYTFKGQKIPSRKSMITKRIKQRTASPTVKKLMNRTIMINKRINQINYTYGRKGAWGSDKLVNLLDKSNLRVVQNGKIVIPKNISKKDAELINNAYDRFLKYKTSSIEGIAELEKEQIQNIKNRLSNEDVEISKEDAEVLYRFWEDKDFNAVTDKIKGSDLWVILSESKAKGFDENQYLKTISNYIEIGNDVDMKNHLINIYNKFLGY